MQPSLNLNSGTLIQLHTSSSTRMPRLLPWNRPAFHQIVLYIPLPRLFGHHLTRKTTMTLLSLTLQAPALLAIFLGLYFLWVLVSSPLKSIPGPIFAKCTNLWRLLDAYGGRSELTHRLLHEKYGSAVRIGPNVVSVSDPKLLRTIYNTRGDFLKVITPVSSIWSYPNKYQV